MPEVVRGSRPSLDEHRTSSTGQRRNVHFGPASPPLEEEDSRPPLSPMDSGSRSRRKSVEFKKIERRHTEPPEERPAADAYYDSRAATKREFKRRASTLADYYKQNPTLLPQLPFTWRHGWRRFRLGLLILLIFVDACVMPIVLYYAMTFAGHVQGWIVFAVITAIWGGPTYLEFAVRSWRLMKKEDFFRPLGTKSRWAFDFVHWLSVFTITVVTALLIIGAAPHIVWLRVLSTPGPALMLCFGAGVMFPTTLSLMKKDSPFRISSTSKGEPVLPGVLYIIEDVVAVNANAGRPYREAVHARYNASPRFRRMVMNQSLFWGIPLICIGLALLVIVSVHTIKKEVAYGLGWGIPFVWAVLWGFLSVIWVKRDMRMERITWEMDHDVDPGDKKLQVETPSTPEPTSDGEAEPKSAPPIIHPPELPRGRDEEPKPDLESKRDEEPKSQSADNEDPKLENEKQLDGDLVHDKVTEPDLEAQEDVDKEGTTSQVQA